MHYIELLSSDQVLSNTSYSNQPEYIQSSLDSEGASIKVSHLELEDFGAEPKGAASSSVILGAWG